MDSVFYLKAVLLGVIEGLTEFLPISSTGHLIIAGDLLKFTRGEEKTFEVFIQLGAILSVCWYFRSRLAQVARHANRDPAAQRFVLNLAIAFIPAAALGAILHGYIKQYLFSPVVVASALIAGGIAILVIEHCCREARVREVDSIGPGLAFKVGLAQAVALIPGVSRSGATIMGGMLAGLSREAATEFSFFLAIPIMFAATGYDLARSWQLLQVEDIGFFVAGFVAAFLSALATIKFLLRFVATHSFRVFAWYRIVFGLVVLYYYLIIDPGTIEAGAMAQAAIATGAL